MRKNAQKTERYPRKRKTIRKTRKVAARAESEPQITQITRIGKNRSADGWLSNTTSYSENNYLLREQLSVPLNQQSV